MVVCAYGATALVVLAAVVLLRRAVSPAVLHGVLGFFFVAALTAGLEPATVKAAVLRHGGQDATAAIDPWAYLAAGALKALIAAPFLALVWRFADPSVALTSLAWLPLVAFAGFGATDLRVLFDVQGRHARAVWLKQGGLAAGYALVAALVGAGLPMGWAIGAGTGARVALVLAVAVSRPRPSQIAAIWRQARHLLADSRWIELAGVSVIAASSGSIDRLVGLRYLAPAVYGGYFLLYEMFSKFWLIPYLVTPIVFARRAAGQESERLVRWAWWGVLGAGAIFLLGVSGALVFAPGLAQRFLGIALGPAALAFAAAVVIGALTQLRVTELQAAGAVRWALGVVGLGAVLSAILFFEFVRRWGLVGLLWAWPIKSGTELLLALAGGRRGASVRP